MIFRPWLHSGAPGAILGAPGAVLGATRTRFGRSGNALGGPWGTLGPLLGRSWILLGRSWGLLEASCTDFELELNAISILDLNLRPKMEASWHQNPLKSPFQNQCDFTPRFSFLFNVFFIVFGIKFVTIFEALWDSCTYRGFCENMHFPLRENHNVLENHLKFKFEITATGNSKISPKKHI